MERAKKALRIFPKWVGSDTPYARSYQAGTTQKLNEAVELRILAPTASAILNFPLVTSRELRRNA